MCYPKRPQNSYETGPGVTEVTEIPTPLPVPTLKALVTEGAKSDGAGKGDASHVSASEQVRNEPKVTEVTQIPVPSPTPHTEASSGTEIEDGTDSGMKKSVANRPTF